MGTDSFPHPCGCPHPSTATQNRPSDFVWLLSPALPAARGRARCSRTPREKASSCEEAKPALGASWPPSSHISPSLTTTRRAYLGAAGANTTTHIRLQAHIAEALFWHGGDKLNTMQIPKGLRPRQALEWKAGEVPTNSVSTFWGCTSVHQSQQVALVSHWIQVKNWHQAQSLSFCFWLE